MFEDKRIAIVTGASSGIGAEISRHLKNENNLEIWLVARRLERLESLAQDLKDKGAQVRVLALDLQKPEAWDSLVEEVKASKSAVAWLVNNAGYGYAGRFTDQSVESIAGMIQLNFTALVAITHRMLPFMGKNSHIVNIASAIAFFPAAGHALYGATKAAVLSFSLALREEVKTRGITVSAICPGPVATEFWDAAGADAPLKLVIENASNTAFFAVEKASQGQAIVVTGFLAWVARIASALLPKALIAQLTAKQLKREIR